METGWGRDEDGTAMEQQKQDGDNGLDGIRKEDRPEGGGEIESEPERSQKGAGMERDCN